MFKNEPVTDFAVSSERSRFSNALAKLDSQIKLSPLSAAPILGDKNSFRGQDYIRNDPSIKEIVLCRTKFADIEDVEEAVSTALKGFYSWREVTVEHRAACLDRAAGEMRERRAELSAIMIREAGKPWREADADVGEAIDFCVYYAMLMRELGKDFITQHVPGEQNVYFYEPRGVAAVIAPWNFPLAIACGMAVAALVTGNSVVLKPAEQTSYIAYELTRILHRAGVPRDALVFLPGYGEKVGKALVEHRNVASIVFTGSRTVGLEILRACGEVKSGQQHIKRAILELGGKNAIIVDEDADLDEAIRGVVYSSFGFAGQKCSACSRVIVVGAAFESFVTRMVEATRDLIVGPSAFSETAIGPVIDEESKNRIERVVETGRSELDLIFQGDAPKSGNFIPPTIFRNVPTEHSLWTDEIFGPVLCINRSPSFEGALKLANESEYALTGGVYSRSPSNIAHAKSQFRVGNLYINRSCTGSLVCRQPFGGFKMSGLGSKAGGPDYLLHFMDPRTITENTMRRGFTPES